MAQAMSLFDQPADSLPAHLQGFSTTLTSDLVLGGLGRNRLGLKGGRFRLIVSGQEEAVLESTSLEVVIVGAAKGVGRIYYEGAYDADAKTHPLCYSADGVEPGADVTNPQSVKCATCPQNQKGSKITDDGTKTKACTYFKRLAIALVNDPQHRVFQLDGKAMTIFGQGEPAQNKFTLNEYAKRLNTRGRDVAHLVTKLSFDVNSSVPKLYFSPVRLITEDEAPWVQDLVNSDETRTVVTITAITDASDANSEEASPAPVAQPVATRGPAPVTVAKAPTAAPKAATAPAAAPKPAVTIIKKAAAPAPVVVKEVSTGSDDLDAFLAQLDSEAVEETE